MNHEPVTRNPLLEIEQELITPITQLKRKKESPGPGPAAKAQAYDFNEPIELRYNPTYHAANPRPAPAEARRARGQSISLPLEFGGTLSARNPLNASGAMYYVEPFEDDGPAAVLKPAEAPIAAPVVPPAPTEILLKAAVQPLNPPGPTPAPTSPPAGPGPAFNWDDLERTLAPGSSQEQSLAADEDASAFMNDLRAVMSGQKQVAPTEPPTPAGITQAEQPATPATTPPQITPSPAAPLPPELEGPHAIFDQMGAGLAHATTYNLGPVALEERFNVFDQSIPAAPPKTAPRSPAASQPGADSGAPVMPGLQRMDLIEDFSYLSEAANAPALSGASWVSQFPTSTSLDDLEADFGNKVKAFNSALAAAGATSKINATRRPKERAYLMHWAWTIAKQDFDASQVPAMSGVNINWNHGSQETSRQAAQEMVNAYGIQNLEVAPALNSRHIEGKAVDMEVSWTGDLSIKKADGSTQTITSEPRNHTNAGLIEVAKTYGVVHFKEVSKDKVHWSTDGR